MGKERSMQTSYGIRSVEISACKQTNPEKNIMNVRSLIHQKQHIVI